MLQRSAFRVALYSKRPIYRNFQTGQFTARNNASLHRITKLFPLEFWQHLWGNAKGVQKG